MKNKKTLLLLTLVFVFLLIGASVLYNFLSKNIDTNPLLTPNNTSSETDTNQTPDSDVSNSETNHEINNSETNSSETNNSEINNSETSNSENKNSETTVTTTNPAPDFTVTDITGTQVHLSDFIGKPVILNFWASWCGPCKSEMPDFDAAYAEYKDDIHFLMVNLTDGSRETVEIASDYIMEQGYSFPVYYDTLSEATITYGVYSVPTTYFIDTDGNLIAQAQGAIDRQTLQTGIDMIYSAK